MKYIFSEFILDAEKKELYLDDEVIYLTKHSYQLLLYFVQHPQAIIDKEMLIEKVWKGRIVADNSIDQSIYKIKKQLNDINEGKYFETVYGHGVRFLPDVNVEDEFIENNDIITKHSNHKKPIILIIILIILLSLIWYQQTKLISKGGNRTIQPTLLVLPSTDKSNSSKWLSKSSPLLIEKLLETSHVITLKNYSDKPDNLSQQQYLEAQWKITPNLKVVTTDVSFEDNIFSIYVSLTDVQQKNTSKTFKSAKLQIAYLAASVWLSENISDKEMVNSFGSTLSENSNILELYLRGLSAISNNKNDKAKNYFELCLNDSPTYSPALIELAKLVNEDGDAQRAMSLLDLVEFSNDNSNIEVQLGLIRGGILYKQGSVELAEKLYTDLLNKYKGHQGQDILNLKLKLSRIYRYQSKNNEVLRILNELEEQLISTTYVELLAKVYKEKGSMLLKMSEIKKAKASIKNALKLYNVLGNLYGVAASLAISARIESHQANYDAASEYLKQTLDIMKKINNKRGVAATLNEIINLSLTQGKLNHAWELNQDFERIAIDIDYTSMLLASKVFTIEMSMAKKDWDTAEIYLKEHKELANTGKNQYALTHNKLYTITLKTELGELINIPSMLKDVQTYIDETNDNIWQPVLDLVNANYYFAINQPEKAVSLLIATKHQLEKSQNGHHLIEINNSLAKHYLETNKPAKVLAVFESTNQKNSVPYPYLLLKSKAYFMIGNYSKSLEFASLCKRLSFDLWSVEDEAFLAKIFSLKSK